MITIATTEPPSLHGRSFLVAAIPMKPDACVGCCLAVRGICGCPCTDYTRSPFRKESLKGVSHVNFKRVKDGDIVKDRQGNRHMCLQKDAITMSLVPVCNQ